MHYQNCFQWFMFKICDTYIPIGMFNCKLLLQKKINQCFYNNSQLRNCLICI